MRTPEELHEARKRELEGERAALLRRSGRISTFRLFAFLGASVLVFLRGFGYLPALAGYLATVPAIGFVILVIVHARLHTRERRVEAAIRYRTVALTRLAGRSSSLASRGDRFANDTHPYTSDLGIFGQASLFQLLDTTFTRRGEDRLAAWLGAPSPVEEVLARQKAVGDLARRDLLREELAAEGLLIATDKPDPDPLIRWAESRPILSAIPLVGAAAYVMPAVTITLLVAGELELAPRALFFVAIAVQWLYNLALQPKIEPIATATSSREGALARYRAMLALVEKEPFESPRASALRSELVAEETASARIGALSSIVGYLDARHNEVFRFFIGPLFLWDVHCILALERWQKRTGPSVRRWLEALGEIEALASLAGFSADHPEHAFPTFVPEPTFDARELGHPLIHRSQCVRNDVRLEGAGTALFVTGSNMSGKSTLLRSMGVNAVLAMAGSPVSATSLVLSTFEVRASMSAHDSLEQGVSYFYAEVKKLKRVIDGLASPRPLFFLLDEILQGTNSRERFIGARGVLRHLLKRGALGAVSTHDVGLLDLGPDLEPRVSKVHFEEQVTSGVAAEAQMSFDYRLRPGVVRSTNALKLMRAVGIELDLPPEQEPGLRARDLD